MCSISICINGKILIYSTIAIIAEYIVVYSVILINITVITANS